MALFSSVPLLTILVLTAISRCSFEPITFLMAGAYALLLFAVLYFVMPKWLVLSAEGLWIDPSRPGPPQIHAWEDVESVRSRTLWTGETCVTITGKGGVPRPGRARAGAREGIAHHCMGRRWAYTICMTNEAAARLLQALEAALPA
ncbi:MAG: hypothetical protein IT209_10660 [Armatimonadetes bacterium]|nr:hypothetical protein [Armatimonadota bacterium]